jgi:hypothetical protein
MNLIQKKPLHSIGYNFIAPEFLPKGKTEYHLRNSQNRTATEYRQLTAFEIESLVRNNNTSDDWNKLLVSNAFNPDLVKNCKFFGLVRIGKLEPWYLEFHNLRMPVGLYNSTIISSDLGDNIVIDNVNYLSHYVIGNDVMIVNVNELATTSTAKFGNGILKEGEKENTRIWLEVCNENAGRSILPFNGMLPGDAYLWAKYRDDEKMLARFKEFTDKNFNAQRGYYGKIGDRTVIKNCKIIKDVWIGTDAYLKGANKIKNVTIHSFQHANTQVGEGCELVNGIISEGCRVFYGVKAVRFFMASHSQLKYGARLINSYLGNNSTISCCEVLNSLIYPFHEQHHNNSFLCASTLMGQSNVAAGATIGSNHNSRGADGELVAGRGFWPGLCVSLKHNSRFASFMMIAKGDYPAELNIPLPFSLVSQDLGKNQLQVMPAYWFMYNFFALCRNEWKYQNRDLRKEKIQLLEMDAFAPDSINEMFDALNILTYATGKAYLKKEGKKIPSNMDMVRQIGKDLLDSNSIELNNLEILADGFENSNRKVVILKVLLAYNLYIKIIRFYSIEKIIEFVLLSGLKNISEIKKTIPASAERSQWINIGGQLIPSIAIEKIRENIRSGKVKNWNDIHQFYALQSLQYPVQKLKHAFASLMELGVFSKRNFDKSILKELIGEAIETKKWILEGIISSRKKDYTNPFRKMVYENDAEMEKVIGKLSENSFIKLKGDEILEYKKKLTSLSGAIRD